MMIENESTTSTAACHQPESATTTLSSILILFKRTSQTSKRWTTGHPRTAKPNKSRLVTPTRNCPQHPFLSNAQTDLSKHCWMEWKTKFTRTCKKWLTQFYSGLLPKAIKFPPFAGSSTANATRRVFMLFGLAGFTWPQNMQNSQKYRVHGRRLRLLLRETASLTHLPSAQREKALSKFLTTTIISKIHSQVEFW